MQTFTTPSGEAIDYKSGDLVDFFRPPATKDDRGWKGPATVIENLPGSGQVKIKYKKGDILVKYPQARRFMDFTGIVFGILHANTPHRQALQVVTRFLNAYNSNRLHTFGAMQTSKGMQITQESKAQKRVAVALVFTIENVFQLVHVTCVQIGRGIAKIPATRRGGSRTVILRHKDPKDQVTLTTNTENSVRCRDLSEENWAQWYCVSADHYANSTLHLDDCLRSAGLGDDDQSSAGATGGIEEPSVNDRLSTIPEETEDSEPSWTVEIPTPGEIMNELSLLGFIERSDFDDKSETDIH